MATVEAAQRRDVEVRGRDRFPILRSGEGGLIRKTQSAASIKELMLIAKGGH